MRTRLVADEADAAALRSVGEWLGSLAGADLAVRCSQGRLDARGRAASRKVRKQALTTGATSRWAGAITRSSEDAWSLAERNLAAEARSLRARAGRIRRRLAVAPGDRRDRIRGYPTQAERWQKQQQLQALSARLAGVEACQAAGRMSVCRGGKRLARVRHNLQAAGLGEDGWRQRWQARRWFFTADGEKDKAWGNETIRWHPGEHWLEIRLPRPLEHLANRPHGRYRLSAPVVFGYRGDDVAAQAETGPVRYDITFDPERGRWYLDASWGLDRALPPDIDDLRHAPVLAADLNVGHLAAWVLDPSGNPVGQPRTIALVLAGQPAQTRDGRLRAAISELISVANSAGARAIAVEDLDFVEARIEGRERTGNRPGRGRAGRRFRAAVADIPTAQFRNRLAQMAVNAGLAVVAVDPAYTSRWGAQHWLAPLRHQACGATGHHAAAVVIGRRALGQRARRRAWCDPDPPVDGRGRAACSAAWPAPAPAGLPGARSRNTGPRKADGQPPRWRKTQPADRSPPADQGGEDRSLRPETAISHSLLR